MTTREGGRTPRALLVTLVGLTAAHALYRWGFAGAPKVEAALVSELPEDTPMPALQVDVATRGGWATGPLLKQPGCQVVVAFDPACPHCLRAARAESVVDPARRLPTTWVTRRGARGVERYRDELGAETRVVRSDAVIEALRVEGVPAAFLVDTRGVVRRAWAYKGTETRRALERACEVVEEGGGAARPPAAVSARPDLPPGPS